MAAGSPLPSSGTTPKEGRGRPGAAFCRRRVDVAETPRTGLPLRSRLAAASPRPRKRIVGESVLTVTLSGIALLLHTTETGSVARGGALALLGEGLSDADAGARLHMSEATVKTYVSRILAKLDCDNGVQAALQARDAGLEPSAG